MTDGQKPLVKIQRAELVKSKRAPTGKLIVFAVIVLFLWHAALRIFHMLHDFGVHAGTGAKLVCFGIPLLCTIAAAYFLLTIGM